MLPSLIALPESASDHVVAHTPSGPVRWSQFRSAAIAWQERLAARPGTSVALYQEDTLRFAQALIGAWRAGKQVVLPGDLLPGTVASLSPIVDEWIALSPGDDDPLASATPASPPRTIASPALVLSTSGSSGSPVAVGKGIEQLDSELRALEAAFGGEVGDADVAGTVSHQHIYGLLFRLLWPLCTRRPFHSRRFATPEQIAAMPGSSPVALVASPAHLKRLSDLIDWRHAAARLRAVFSSGGPLSAPAHGEATRLLGRAPIEVFGSTETGGVAWRRQSGAAWRNLPGVESRVVDGVIEVRSAHLPDRDWYRTADLAREHGEGFELLGRADRIVKIEERRVSLAAMEDRLLASDRVAEAKAVLIPGDRSVIGMVAVLTQTGLDRLAEEGKREMARSLRDWLKDKVEAIALPRRWRFVTEMPTDSQGKSSQSLLLALFRPRTPAPRWLSREERQATLELDVQADLAAFDGHFPEVPVVPGVALVDWAVHFGRDAFRLPDRFVAVEILKFHALVRPRTRLALQLDWRPESNALHFTFKSAQGDHASGRLQFASGDQ